jgi:hypothetical protein
LQLQLQLQSERGMFERSQYKKFSVEENGFNFKGEFHDFNNIAHIFFTRIHTTQSMNFVKVGEADSSYLHITLDSGKKIKLSFDEAGIFLGFNSNKQTDLKNLTDLYIFLSEKSFQKRISKHIKDIKDKGYFIYDECYFYPAQKKIVFRNKEFPVETSSFLKGYGYIELRKKDFGFLDKVKREVSLTKTPQFNTQTDTDVIFTLLDQYFGLRWKN